MDNYSMLNCLHILYTPQGQKWATGREIIAEYSQAIFDEHADHHYACPRHPAPAVDDVPPF